MLLSAKEVKTCIEFVLTTMIHDQSIEIKDSHLVIDDKIRIQAVVKYQDHVVDMNASFLADYQDNQLYISDIQGKVEYLFLQLNIMNVLKQLLNFEEVKIGENNCIIKYPLPIKSIQIHQQQLQIQLK